MKYTHSNFWNSTWKKVCCTNLFWARKTVRCSYFRSDSSRWRGIVLLFLRGCVRGCRWILFSWVCMSCLGRSIVRRKWIKRLGILCISWSFGERRGVWLMGFWEKWDRKLRVWSCWSRCWSLWDRVDKLMDRLSLTVIYRFWVVWQLLSKIMLSLV